MRIFPIGRAGLLREFCKHESEGLGRRRSITPPALAYTQHDATHRSVDHPLRRLRQTFAWLGVCRVGSAKPTNVLSTTHLLAKTWRTHVASPLARSAKAAGLGGRVPRPAILAPLRPTRENRACTPRRPKPAASEAGRVASPQLTTASRRPDRGGRSVDLRG